MSTLPRELIDSILTFLISLHDDDPAYQWTRLRLLTRHTKTLIEQHFYAFWVPRLSFAASIDDRHVDNHIYFEPLKEHKSSSLCSEKHENGLPILVAFEADLDAEDLALSFDERGADAWIARVLEPERVPLHQSAGEKQLILRLGEGTLNKGFTKGGIVSDVVIPRARMHTGSSPWQLTFAWQTLFSNLFREEMLSKRLRDALLKRFLAARQQGESEGERNEAIYHFLNMQYRPRCKALLAAFREHVGLGSRATRWQAQRLDSHIDGFDITSFLNSQLEQLPYTDSDATVENTGGEQSIVFQIPGWETWSICELARLRIMDEYIVEDEMLPREGLGYAGQQYYDEMRVREEKMRGREEASEETLEEFLRGPSLDPKMFFDW